MKRNKEKAICAELSFAKVTLATGRWFSLCTPVSSTNKTDHQNIIEILLKVALNTITKSPSTEQSIFFNIKSVIFA
jgi:hypothetical protein